MSALKEGSFGPEVAKLQGRLRELGFNFGPAPLDRLSSRPRPFLEGLETCMETAARTFQDALHQLQARQQRLERSGLLRAGNEPEVLHHGKATSEVILLIYPRRGGLGEERDH